ncbi:MAG: hypothetical protein AAFY98_07235 [Verrucomicrobiota bacterium]
MSEANTDSAKTESSFWTFLLVLLAITGLGLVSLLAIQPKTPIDVAYEERSQQRSEARMEIQQEADEKTTSYAWQDQGAGSVRIPVSQAMKVSLTDLQKVVVTPSDELAPLAPGPSDAPVVRKIEVVTEPDLMEVTESDEGIPAEETDTGESTAGEEEKAENAKSEEAAEGGSE